MLNFNSVNHCTLVLPHLTAVYLNWVSCKATQFSMAATSQNKLGHSVLCDWS